MNNGPDYSVHRATGAGEIAPQRMVTNQKDDRPRGFGKRKGRARNAEADDAEGVKVDLSQGDLPDPSDPSDRSDPSDDDSQDSKSVDCLA